MLSSLLCFTSFDTMTDPQNANAKDTTLKFIELMRSRYGSEEKIGRGNIFNFGRKVSYAIGNSKLLDDGKYFFGIQADFLASKFKANLGSPLGIYAALICGSEQSVVLLPHATLTEIMKNATSDRVTITQNESRYYLRVTGSPILEVTDCLNKYPGTIEDHEAVGEETHEVIETTEHQQGEINEHTRIQWMLIRFGHAAGCTVWVPAGDRGKEFEAEKFVDMTCFALPNFGFDASTKQIISNIDVLWLEGNVIHKAFEIESTTSIYSGLLRMSDLVVSQPNISIDLHIVAPLRRRELVKKNILRPSFSRLRSKCSYISFEEIIAKYDVVKVLLQKQHMQIKNILDSETF